MHARERETLCMPDLAVNTMVFDCIVGCDIARGSMQTSGMATEIVEELKMVSEGVDENHNTSIRLEILIFPGSSSCM